MNWPGPRPIHGDQVRVITGSDVMTFVGDIKSVGVMRDGCGSVELTLPDADPQQRRALEGATGLFEYWMYRGDSGVPIPRPEDQQYASDRRRPPGGHRYALKGPPCEESARR
ncbi:hypothetical protein GCM10010211_80180 [Streptomyces albospinus]|uniref:Uncharacterized protein n=1 Tax=Streptomyces albospinus TaxID=285515 RepID=A0ABQ2VRB9_9ACTN|nr:hypothetical protein GCM10010211_80180 [Streptomyces albospinus]